MNTDGLYKDLTYKIIGALYEVHKELGSVHKEIIYHKAVAIELNNRNIPFTEEKSINVKYKGNKKGGGYLASSAVVRHDKYLMKADEENVYVRGLCQAACGHEHILIPFGEGASAGQKGLHIDCYTNFTII